MDRGNGSPSVIILGGSFSSLGVARDLARHGVPVYILDRGVCVARFSRHVRRTLKCPPEDDEAGLVEFLLRLAEERNLEGSVLFASTDEGVEVLGRHRERLGERYLVTTPPWDVVKFVHDKRLTYQLARQQGVAIPETRYPGNADDLASLDLQFPVVVKPAISSHFISVTKKKAYRANDTQELLELYERMAAIVGPSEILIQELIPGCGENLYSFVGYFKEGVPVASLSARRPRQHPMDFGRASTFVETVNIPELGPLATQLLEGIKYSGLAEVEFMYHEKNASFELLEVNPRIWGWLSIAAHAGLDLPYLAYADAVGKEVAVGPAREGAKWVRLVTDIPTVLLEILGGRLTVRQYLASMSGGPTCAVLSLTDPLPFIADVLLVPYYMKHRGF